MSLGLRLAALRTARAPLTFITRKELADSSLYDINSQ